MIGLVLCTLENWSNLHLLKNYIKIQCILIHNHYYPLFRLPDPEIERGRTRINYDPEVHHYKENEKLEMREITPNHFVFCSEKEYEDLVRKYRN